MLVAAEVMAGMPRNSTAQAETSAVLLHNPAL